MWHEQLLLLERYATTWQSVARHVVAVGVTIDVIDAVDAFDAKKSVFSDGEVISLRCVGLAQNVANVLCGRRCRTKYCCEWIEKYC